MLASAVVSCPTALRPSLLDQDFLKKVLSCGSHAVLHGSGTAVGAVAFGWTSRPGTAGVVVGMLAELGFGIFVMSPLVQFPPLAPHMVTA